MYFGSSKKREAAKAAFQQERNLNTGELLHKDPPDVLIGLIRIMETGLNLHQASVVIIIEPMYDPNLFLQVPKRAHRLGQPKEVWCYTIRTNTAIEGRSLGLFGDFFYSSSGSFAGRLLLRERGRLIALHPP